MNHSSIESEVEKWWWETNGSGTGHCSNCRHPHICAWHSARFEDLRALIVDSRVEWLQKVLRECNQQPTDPVSFLRNDLVGAAHRVNKMELVDNSH